MPYYFVCACNAKWFAPVSSVDCPRCGTPSTSTETLTPPWELENEVLTIKCPSDKPCRLCKGKEKTVEVTFRDKTFTGVMCTDCIYKELVPQPPRVAKTA